MPSQTLVATLECAGNGRSMFSPPVDGEQWRLGAVSTAEWTGVPLVEVLDRAGPQPGRPRRSCSAGPTRQRRGVDGADPLRAWPVTRRRARLRGAARLRDERRAAPAPARLPAARHRSGMVRRHVGQMADRHRGHRPSPFEASSRRSATSTSGSGTGPRSENPYASNRSARSSPNRMPATRIRRRRPGHPRCRHGRAQRRSPPST